MKIYIKKVYDNALLYLQKKSSWFMLSVLSFLESIFFPIPVDVFLAPMIVLNKSRAIFLVTITIIFSVLGGILGYYIGFYFWDIFSYKIINLHPNFEENFQFFTEKFDEFGWLIVIIGGFTPLPYKVITISSGILNLNIYLFILFSLISRGARFILVGYLFYKYGLSIKSKLEKNINIISILLILIFLIFLITRYIL
tara:strand:+ start:70 stop:660 length:591 start_codon:yes stop_codon:yes gene_type:complete